MRDLNRVLGHLEDWRKQRTAKQRAKLCLTAVRYACGCEALALPRGDEHYTALECFEALARHPGDYGWQAIHHDAAGKLETPCLVFYKGCGKLADGRIAGHVAILSGGVIHSNENYQDNQYWRSRLVGAFVVKAA